MSNVISLGAARQKKALDVAQLIALCAATDPPQQTMDLERCVPTLTPESAAQLRELFKHFGVVELDPITGCFDTVLNTWYQLVGKVKAHLKSGDFISDTANQAVSKLWHPAYAAYIRALKFGSREAVLEAARGLNIQAGIPKGSPRPYKGPLKAE